MDWARDRGLFCLSAEKLRMGRRIMELGTVLTLVCLSVVYFGGKKKIDLSIAKAPSDSRAAASRPAALEVTPSPLAVAANPIPTPSRRASGERPPEMSQDWREVEIDGLRMTMDADQVAAVAGKPAKVGSVYFVQSNIRKMDLG